jgi:Transposase
MNRDGFSVNGELVEVKNDRVFEAEFKLAALQRMQQGESPSALARELGIRRKQLYEWRAAVLAGRPLLKRGEKKQDLELHALSRDPIKRVKELEQLLGQVMAENRFFKGALQRIKELRQQNEKVGAAASTRRSKR